MKRSGTKQTSVFNIQGTRVIPVQVLKEILGKDEQIKVLLPVRNLALPYAGFLSPALPIEKSDWNNYLPSIEIRASLIGDFLIFPWYSSLRHLRFADLKGYTSF